MGQGISNEEASLKLRIELNDLLEEGNFDRANEALEGMEVADFDFILTALVATQPAHDKLPVRADLYRRVLPMLREHIKDENVIKRLSGVE